MVHVCPSTIDALAQLVEDGNGVALVSNRTVKRLEQKDRLRLERLNQVFRLLRQRGLTCYPETSVYADETCRFVVYRAELTTVDLQAVAREADLLTAMECVMKSLRHPYWHNEAPFTWQLRRALVKLSAAQRGSSLEGPRRLSAA